MKTTKEMIAVMQAYEDGKEIEFKPHTGKTWISMKLTTIPPIWSWSSDDYRIKPEPEYIPFTFEDAEFLIGKVVKCKTQDYTAMIISCTQLGTNVDDWKPMLDDFTFIDGSPCGKLKQ